MYVRPVPAVRFGLAGVVAVVLCAMLLGAWEGYFRGVGARPATVNSDALWALQRERINHGEGDATVLIGSSRVLFDVQPAVWERLDGRRPIQLALQGTSAVPALENLAATLGHDDHARTAAQQTFHDAALIGIGLFEHGVQRDDHRNRHAV